MNVPPKSAFLVEPLFTACQSLKRLCVLLVISWLISCTTVPPSVPTQPQFDFITHQQQLNHIRQWTLKGKIGFKSEQNTLSATLLWQQQQNTFHIRLSGMLGTTLMEMNGREGQVRLHIDGKDYTGTSAEKLLHNITGWQLPVDQLALLVKGQVPSDGFDVIEATKHWPLQVKEAGQPGHYPLKPWKIRYQQYQPTQSKNELQVWLPYDLKLTKAKNLIKIRVTSWEIH